ncbi:MAG TPA: Calx-beta domain-containing protein [Pyrinomonadaceae bacterium]
MIEVNTTADGDNLNPDAGCDTDAAAPGEQCSLRAAIQRANALAGDEDIRFNIPATQPNCDSATGNCTINLTKALPEVSGSVRIEGPGAAKLTVRRDTGGNYRIFTLGHPGGSAITVTLSGLTVSNGISPENGGGVVFYGKTLNILGCTFSGNAAEGFGGGIHAQGALNVADSVFSGNQAMDQSGGGINAQDALTVKGSTFSDNKAPYFGGGIFANSATSVDARITDSKFERNRAQNGGAIAMSGSIMEVTNSIIRNNTTTAGSGGIYQTAGTLTVNTSTISDNEGFGLVTLRGIIGGAPATANINNSTISGNERGGITTGIAPNADSKLNVTNSTISHNLDDPGITIANRATLNVSHSTISFNQGGGIRRVEPATDPGTWTIKSSIIAMNRIDDVKGDFTSGGFNLIGKTDNSTGLTQPTDQTGTSASPLDPRLDPEGLQNNGGPTRTIALHPGSPAIDRGTANGLQGTLNTDQRGAGFARTYDNPAITNAANGDGTDIGAFERNASDPVPPTVLQLSAATYSINENGGAATITVTRTGDNSNAVSVKYATSAGTATAGTVDYTEASGTLNWAAGDISSKTITVPITNDASDEENETINVTLSDPQGGAKLGGQNQAVLTIVDEDAVPLVNVNFASVNEGNSGATNMVVPITLSVASGKVVTVRVSTVTGGTATAGSDYTPIDNVLVTFQPGQKEASVNVQVFGDTNVEPDETIFVKISNATNGQVAGFQASCRIRNDDVDQATSELKFSAASYTVNEGDGTATINVTRVGSTTGTVTVRYTMASGTATINSDYTNTFGELTFESGQTTKSFTIPIINDSSRELDETATVTLSSPTGGASLGSPSMAVLTIVDNDPQPSISINDVVVIEGNSGTTVAGFTVNLSAPTFETVTVNYATADDTAAAGNDYQPAFAALTFNPGETTKTINVLVNGDPGKEPDETFFFNLSNAQNATISDAQGLGKILNDDEAFVQFSSASYQIKENAGNTPQQFASLSVEVTRTGDVSGPATVRFSTSDASGGNECNQFTGQASQRCDYTLAAGTLRFAAGETSKTISIPITDDGYVEGNELFTIELQRPDGAALGTTTQAVITIEDNDNTPTDAANNPYRSNEFFVRMNYLDFLAREPDAEGWNTWITLLNNCGPEKGFLGAPMGCDRAQVAHGFIASAEFTDRGYYLYRMYEVGLLRLPRYAEFVPDMAATSGAPNSQELKENSNQFAESFTGRKEFTDRYANVSAPNQAAQFIARLEQNAGVVLPDTTTTLPGQPTQYARQELINKRLSGEFTLGQTLKAFVEQKVIYDRFFERGFVTMQYFGFLRRDPDLNDPNLTGWTEWVFVFTNGGAQRGRPDILQRDYHHLTFGFIYSEEYRKRFGQP